MEIDIINKLRDFYNSKEGIILNKLLEAEIYNYWGEIISERILLIGYGISLSDYESNNQIMRFEYISYDNFLSFKDRFFDKIIIINSLEYTTNISLLLSESYRVLKDNGNLITIVQNSKTKLSNYYFSFYDLNNILNDHLFEPVRLSSKLFLPFLFYKYCPNISKIIDSICSKWFIPFGDYLITKSIKKITVKSFNESVKNFQLIKI